MFGFDAKVPEDEPYTKPYFSRPNMEQSYYDVADQALMNQPFAPYPLAATVHLQFAGVSLDTSHVVQVIDKVNGPGTLRFPMPVGPAISVTVNPSAGIVPLGEQSFPMHVRLHNNADGTLKAAVHLKLPSGWTAEPATASLSFEHRGEEQAAEFTVHPGAIEAKTIPDHRYRRVRWQAHSIADTASVGYTGLRPYFLYQQAAYNTTGADVKVAPGLRIAYIDGSGDDVPAALRSTRHPRLLLIRARPRRRRSQSV